MMTLLCLLMLLILLNKVGLLMRTFWARTDGVLISGSYCTERLAVASANFHSSFHIS